MRKGKKKRGLVYLIIPKKEESMKQRVGKNFQVMLGNRGRKGTQLKKKKGKGSAAPGAVWGIT